MPDTGDCKVLELSQGLCRRCVRALSRRLRDLPGMVWFEVDAVAGLVRISGAVDLAEAEELIRASAARDQSLACAGPRLVGDIQASRGRGRLREELLELDDRPRELAVLEEVCRSPSPQREWRAPEQRLPTHRCGVVQAAGLIPTVIGMGVVYVLVVIGMFFNPGLHGMDVRHEAVSEPMKARATGQDGETLLASRRTEIR